MLFLEYFYENISFQHRSILKSMIIGFVDVTIKIKKASIILFAKYIITAKEKKNKHNFRDKYCS